jgi:hypothetical protein
LAQAEAPDAGQVAAKVADNVGQVVENGDQEVRGVDRVSDRLARVVVGASSVVARSPDPAAASAKGAPVGRPEHNTEATALADRTPVRRPGHNTEASFEKRLA